MIEREFNKLNKAFSNDIEENGDKNQKLVNEADSEINNNKLDDLSDFNEIENRLEVLVSKSLNKNDITNFEVNVAPGEAIDEIQQLQLDLKEKFLWTEDFLNALRFYFKEQYQQDKNNSNVNDLKKTLKSLYRLRLNICSLFKSIKSFQQTCENLALDASHKYNSYGNVKTLYREFLSVKRNFDNNTKMDIKLDFIEPFYHDVVAKNILTDLNQQIRFDNSLCLESFVKNLLNDSYDKYNVIQVVENLCISHKKAAVEKLNFYNNIFSDFLQFIEENEIDNKESIKNDILKFLNDAQSKLEDYKNNLDKIFKDLRGKVIELYNINELNKRKKAIHQLIWDAFIDNNSEIVKQAKDFDKHIESFEKNLYNVRSSLNDVANPQITKKLTELFKEELSNNSKFDLYNQKRAIENYFSTLSSIDQKSISIYQNCFSSTIDKLDKLKKYIDNSYKDYEDINEPKKSFKEEDILKMVTNKDRVNYITNNAKITINNGYHQLANVNNGNSGVEVKLAGKCFNDYCNDIRSKKKQAITLLNKANKIDRQKKEEEELTKLINIRKQKREEELKKITNSLSKMESYISNTNEVSQEDLTEALKTLYNNQNKRVVFNDNDKRYTVANDNEGVSIGEMIKGYDHWFAFSSKAKRQKSIFLFWERYKNRLTEESLGEVNDNINNIQVDTNLDAIPTIDFGCNSCRY